MHPSYATAQKAIHWLVFLLVIGLYGLTYAEDLFPRGDPNRDLVWWFHISFGLLLFALVIFRIGLRLVYGAPELPSEMTSLERWLAKIAHLLLYALLVAIPVLGILLTWFRGDALSFFGLFTIPGAFFTGPGYSRVRQGAARALRQSHTRPCRTACDSGPLASLRSQG